MEERNVDGWARERQVVRLRPTCAGIVVFLCLNMSLYLKGSHLPFLNGLVLFSSSGPA